MNERPKRPPPPPPPIPKFPPESLDSQLRREDSNFELPPPPSPTELENHNDPLPPPPTDLIGTQNGDSLHSEPSASIDGHQALIVGEKNKQLPPAPPLPLSNQLFQRNTESSKVRKSILLEEKSVMNILLEEIRNSMLNYSLEF